MRFYIYVLAVLFVISSCRNEKPATAVKIEEILNQEYAKLDRNYTDLIKFLELVDKNKASILEDEECTSFVDINRLLAQLKERIEEKDYLILSKPVYKNIKIKICMEGVQLKLSERIDAKNYLYIQHIFYVGENRKVKRTFYKETCIQNKYYDLINISDAFNDLYLNNNVSSNE